MTGFPERIFYSLNDLEKLWSVENTDIKQWIMHGSLAAHVWLPLLSMIETREESRGAQIMLTKSLRHWEGYTPLFPHHCRTVFKSGRVYLREFMCQDNNARLILPETADSIRIDAHDIVILNEVRKRFENEHHIGQTSICNVKIIGRVGKSKPQVPGRSRFDKNFRKLTFRGQDFSFGIIQADILRQLYEAAIDGDPWQNGKRLLDKASSQSFTIANVFKRNPLWRHLVVSDGRGAYRLSEDFLSSLGDHDPITT